MAASAPLTGDWRTVPLRHAAMMLQQCSRDAPAPGDSYFIPTQAEIEAMESALTTHLRSDGYFAEHSTIVSGHLASNAVRNGATRSGTSISLTNGWSREYLGIVRGGVRSIYGNYSLLNVPDNPPRPGIDYSLPRIVCDGGPTFFGAEFDMRRQQITHLAFNGSA